MMMMMMPRLVVCWWWRWWSLSPSPIPEHKICGFIGKKPTISSETINIDDDDVMMMPRFGCTAPSLQKKNCETNCTNRRTATSKYLPSSQSSFRGCSHITSAAGGGEGVWQMLTIADEGGRGGKPKADHCWRGEVGVWKNSTKGFYGYKKCG